MATHGDRVECDQEECDYFVAFQVLRSDAVPRVTALPLPRYLARKEGWRIDDDGDFCPRHAEV
jgi:hypothetical protein